MQATYQAPSRAIARELAAGVVADYDRKYDNAVASFTDDFEAPEEKVALFRKIRAMTPPLENVDVRAAIRRGRDDEFDG